MYPVAPLFRSPRLAEAEVHAKPIVTKGAHMKWVTIRRFSELSGYSAEAVRSKIKKGVWKYRVHFRKAPDGRVLVNIEEIEKWVESIQG